MQLCFSLRLHTVECMEWLELNPFTVKVNVVTGLNSEIIHHGHITVGHPRSGLNSGVVLFQGGGVS